MSLVVDTEHKTSPSKLIKGITFAIFLIFVGLCFLLPLFLFFVEGPGSAALTAAIDLVIFIPMLWLSWAYSPRKYVVSDKGVLVDRPLSPILIPAGKIAEVRVVEFKIFKTARTWGNGGLFSFTGRFRNKELGKFRMCAKNDNYVLIEADEKYVLTPDDVFRFKSEVEKLIRNKWT